MNPRNLIAIATSFLFACSAASGGNDPSGSGGSSEGGSAGSGGSSNNGGQGGNAAGSAGQSGNAGSITGGTAGSNNNACLKNTFGATAQPANLLFQVDVSGSMNCAPQDSGCGVADPTPGSRWEVFKTQLTTALNALPSQSGAGLLHYPTGKGTFDGNPTGCIPQTPDVALGPLSTTKDQIISKLAQITPEGGTPTHDAIAVALAQLQQSNVAGNKFLVLATDGRATFCAGCDLFCSNDELDTTDSDQLIAQVSQAASSGIRTFVLGAPGSEDFRSVLSKIAQAGQTPFAAGCSDSGPTYCHYDMTTAPDFGTALAAALTAIGTQALSCVYDIPPQDGTFDPALVNVELDLNGQTETIPQDPAHGVGWDYSSDGKQVILYGTACDKAKAALGGAITILYGCPTQQIE